MNITGWHFSRKYFTRFNFEELFNNKGFGVNEKWEPLGHYFFLNKDSVEIREKTAVKQRYNWLYETAINLGKIKGIHGETLVEFLKREQKEVENLTEGYKGLSQDMKRYELTKHIEKKLVCAGIRGYWTSGEKRLICFKDGPLVILNTEDIKKKHPSTLKKIINKLKNKFKRK